MKKIRDLLNKNKQVIVYVIVGIFTTFISLSSYFIFALILDPRKPLQLQVINIISWVLAVTFAFFANKYLVFKTKANKISFEALGFFGLRVLTLIVDNSSMFIMVNIIDIDHRIAKLVIQGIILILNYLLSKFVIFTGNKRYIVKKEILF